jgi:uncharacterized protein YunC (DUF1805 family)
MAAAPPKAAEKTRVGRATHSTKAVVGVGVLDVAGRVDDRDAAGGVNWGVRDLRPLGKAAVERIAVGAQRNIGVAEGRPQGAGLGFWQNRSGGDCAAVARREHPPRLAIDVLTPVRGDTSGLSPSRSV